MVTTTHAHTHTFALCFRNNKGYLQECNTQWIARRGEGRKLKPLEPLLLFYQKLEDKLVEYREKERGALREGDIKMEEGGGG